MVLIILGILFIIIIPSYNRTLYPFCFWLYSFIEIVTCLVVVDYLFNDPKVIHTDIRFGTLAMLIALGAINLLVGVSVIVQEMSGTASPSGSSLDLTTINHTTGGGGGVHGPAAFYSWLFVPSHMGFTLLLLVLGMCDVLLVGMIGSGSTDSSLMRAPWSNPPAVEKRLLVSSAFRAMLTLPFLIMMLYIVHLDAWSPELAWTCVALVVNLVMGTIARVLLYQLITSVQELNTSIAMNTTTFAIDASGTGIVVAASPQNPNPNNGLGNRTMGATPGSVMRGDLSTAHLDLQLISSRYGAAMGGAPSGGNGGNNSFNTTTNRFYATPAPARTNTGNYGGTSYSNGAERAGRPRPLVFTPMKSQ